MIYNILWVFLPLTILNLFFHFPQQNKKQSFYIINGYAQGTTYHITYSQTDSIVTQKQVDSILNKIDSSLSLYKPYSLINRFNNSAAGTVVDDHFIKVVKKSIDTYQQTNGAFDITVKPLVQAWGFGVNASGSLPDNSTIAEIKKCTGSKKLQLKNNARLPDGQELLKTMPCIQIDCNGIAQGYSVDVLADFLEQHNIENYLVELGGEIRVKGKNKNGELWAVGIESSGDDMDFLANQHTIYISNCAVTTSGSYREFYTKDSKKYSHIINPVTGYPVDNGMVSVTVIAKDAITADAYDNAFMVMGLKRSFEFLNGNKDMEAFFVYKKANGIISDTASVGFYRFLNIKK